MTNNINRFNSDYGSKNREFDNYYLKFETSSNIVRTVNEKQNYKFNAFS